MKKKMKKKMNWAIQVNVTSQVFVSNYQIPPASRVAKEIKI